MEEVFSSEAKGKKVKSSFPRFAHASIFKTVVAGYGRLDFFPTRMSAKLWALKEKKEKKERKETQKKKGGKAKEKKKRKGDAGKERKMRREKKKVLGASNQDSDESFH